MEWMCSERSGRAGKEKEVRNMDKRKYNKDKTKTLIKVLHDLEQKNGMVNPHDLVSIAADTKHPLHDLFDWEDSTAAAKWRVHQARNYIREVRVQWMDRDIQGYWGATIQVEDAPLQGYFSTESVATNKKLHRAVLQEAIRELDHWSMKYKDIQELRNIIDTSKLRQVREVNN